MSELLPLLRTLGGLGIVLGVLGAALWVVRRFDLALPGRVGGATTRRVAVVERVQIDGKRALMLVRRDDREHLFVLLPDRVALLEADIAPAKARLAPEPPAFHDMVLCPSLDGEWFNG